MSSCLWLPPAMEARERGAASPAQLPCLCKRKGCSAQQDLRTGRSPFCELRASPRTASSQETASLQLLLKASSTLHDGTAINRCSGPTLWSVYLFFRKTKPLRIKLRCFGHYFHLAPSPLLLLHYFHLLGAWMVNPKPMQHPNPAGKWKINSIFKMLNGLWVLCV